MLHLCRQILNRTFFFTIFLLACAFGTILISTAADATNLTPAREAEQTGYAALAPQALALEKSAGTMSTLQMKATNLQPLAPGAIDTAGTVARQQSGQSRKFTDNNVF